ncbi:flavin-containing monooxygenase [Pseudohoeflea coraliihabitans]|uniref:Trimethylamine monooxygenase n=1 Tax=Pseudohoeflea coraliihabitans TaxID=2860393 RepID=A0ABS6WUX6_9HYPH|nr:NAD(P)-binding domain-containing protein [Pseudohoeflea sp. DP4N28-3]MBW3098835.1 NAD(P)-binding domain-containing protein [Pseudohoeflea sp. DP4N28-3]
MSHYRVCIVGAGPTGLTTVKNLAEAGITDMVCHEAQSETGGIWVYSDDPDRPSVYETAHTISSRKLSQFPDFPMPDSYPEYPSNRQILAYFRAYEEHFGLSPYIRLSSRVVDVGQRPEGGWQITIEDAAGRHVQTSDYLVVCSGHHREPFVPDLPGDFTGEQLHSGRYKKADRFAGQRVLVVGGGNSACDIASTLSRVCDHVSLSIRGPQTIIPKTIAGRPVDVQFAKLQKPYLRFMRDLLARWVIGLAVGPYERYGLQQPRGRLLNHHPTLNTEVLDRIRHGRVTPRPAISACAGRTVQFANGKEGEFDAIIWATGYHLGSDFLHDVSLGDTETAQVPLYLKMMAPGRPDLFFVGLIQPMGCIWVLADLQARIVARQIKGEWSRPADMPARIERALRRDRKRYRQSPRHAVQVDTHEYSRELAAILRQPPASGEGETSAPRV